MHSRRKFSRIAVAVPAAVLLSIPLTAAPALAAPAVAPAAGRAVQAAAALRVKPALRWAIRHDATPPLRSMKRIAPQPSASSNGASGAAHRLARAGVRVVPAPRTQAAAPHLTGQPVTADVQTSNPLDDMPSFGANFDGISSANGSPRDGGAVGPDDYVQTATGQGAAYTPSFAVYSKQGALLYGPAADSTLWQGFSGSCGGLVGDDFSVQYDEQAGRWFMSALALIGGGGAAECIGVSQTSDPLGSWYRYGFQLSSGETFASNQSFGIWPDGYYMSATLGNAEIVYAFDRAQMLAGQQAQDVSFTLASQYSSVEPTNAEGGGLGFDPPAGAPDPFFMSCDAANGGPCASDQIDEWDFHVDWTTPANSTFGSNLAPSQAVPVDTFDSHLCDYSTDCLAQPGTSGGLDPVSYKLMPPAVYRNLGGTQAIVLNQTVNVSPKPSEGSQAGIRWYELTGTGSGWTVGQQGTYAPDGANRWMGGVNIDASGDIAVGYSVSSSSQYPSIAVAGRLAGDPAGQFTQGETTMMTGGGSLTDNGYSGWGGSSMTVDPADGCTFWFTAQYLPVTDMYNVNTRIGSFTFPGCTAGQRGQVSGTVTDAGTGVPIAGAQVATSLGTTVTDSQGKYTLVLPAGSYDLTTSAFDYTDGKASGVQIGNGGTVTQNFTVTAIPTVTVTGTVTDGSGHGYPLYASLDFPGRPDGPVLTNPATGQYTVNLPENQTLNPTVTATLPGYEAATSQITTGTSGTTQNIQLQVDSACTAPGYQLSSGTCSPVPGGLLVGTVSDANTGSGVGGTAVTLTDQPAVNETFDDYPGDGGTTPAPGWTIQDNEGNGQVWTFSNPGNYGNRTGGTGLFAMVDSTQYAAGSAQDTSLVSPVFSLSGAASPVLQFNSDFQNDGNSTASVDLSTDGGQTWTNVWQRNSYPGVSGPDLEQVPIPQAAGQSTVRIRFHYTDTSVSGGGNFEWWQVDNVTVANAAIQAAATSAPLTQGPSLPVGYYQVFAPLTGSHSFTAAEAGYVTQRQTVSVTANATAQVDFTLAAPRLSVSAPAVTSTQVLGSTTKTKLTIKNTGTAPASVTLDQRNGISQILSQQGAPLHLVQPAQASSVTAPTAGRPSAARAAAGKAASPNAAASVPSGLAWSPIASYPTTVEDNATAFGDGMLYSVGGYTVLPGGFSQALNTAYAYNTKLNVWTQLRNMPQTLDKPGAAFVNGKLYVSGGNSNASGTETYAYDPQANSWSSLADNPQPTAAPGVAVAGSTIYFVGGCAVYVFACGATSEVLAFNTVTGSWSTVAPYPHPVAWESCGGINGKIYCAGGSTDTGYDVDGYVYNPSANTWSPIAAMPLNLWGSAYDAASGLLVITDGATGSQETNQGLAYDPTTNAWTALPNNYYTVYRTAGACGYYQIGGDVGGFSPQAVSEQLPGLGGCAGTSLKWLTLSNSATVTLQPGQSTTVTVTLAATAAAKVTQPGTFTAQLGVENNTPYTVSPVNVTMSVTPPAGWGELTGTVTGTTCQGVSGPVAGAQVQAAGKKYTIAVQTDQNGDYTLWAPSSGNPFKLAVSLNGWVPKTVSASIKPGGHVTANVTLSPIC